jgi:hypothetical protein
VEAQVFGVFPQVLPQPSIASQILLTLLLRRIQYYELLTGASVRSINLTIKAVYCLLLRRF